MHSNERPIRCTFVPSCGIDSNIKKENSERTRQREVGRERERANSVHFHRINLICAKRDSSVQSIEHVVHIHWYALVYNRHRMFVLVFMLFAHDGMLQSEGERVPWANAKYEPSQIEIQPSIGVNDLFFIIKELGKMLPFLIGPHICALRCIFKFNRDASKRSP